MTEPATEAGRARTPRSRRSAGTSARTAGASTAPPASVPAPAGRPSAAPRPQRRPWPGSLLVLGGVLGGGIAGRDAELGERLVRLGGVIGGVRRGICRRLLP